MGYETKLYIGKSRFTSEETKKGELTIENGECYRPYLKNKNGGFINTGRTETYFSVYAMIDLCKCGSESAIHKLNRQNEDKKHFWYFYGEDGNKPISEDRYGDSLKPVPIGDVIAAIECDMIENSEYRRFKWALGLLNTMKDDNENLEILVYGH